MPKVYVYDSYDNKFFRYNLSENDPMPYSADTTLRVREFRGALTQLTRDHRFALGGRHELYQYLGASDEDTEISPTIGKIDRVAGERLLLCTDGVSEKLSDEELAAMLTAHPDAGDAAVAIIAAVKSVATDNATVLVVDL